MPPFSSIAALISSIAVSYGLGEILSVEQLMGGTTQANYLLKVRTSTIIVRYYLTRSFDYVSFEVDALNQLAALRFECQQPLADIHGRFVGQHGGRPFAVFGYMEGEHDQADDKHIQVASAIARMHLLSQPMHFVASAARNRYDQRSCLRAAELSLSSNSGDVRARAIYDWLRKQIESLDLSPELPIGLCHCDLNPSNFLYKRGVLSAVLDFDMAARIELLYDVANLIYWWANPAMDAEGWQERAKEALFAYQALRPLTVQERHHLYDMLKLVFLTSVAWFLHLPDETAEDRKGVEVLDKMGPLAFSKCLFDFVA